MCACLEAKFKAKGNEQFKEALKATRDAYLLEHNNTADRDYIWSDNHKGDGANWLGLQLMLLRDEIDGRDRVPGSWTSWIRAMCTIDTTTGKPSDPEGLKLWRQSVQDAANIVLKQFPPALRRAGSRQSGRGPPALARGESGGRSNPSGGSATCATPGCGKPSWNGQRGEYCSKACRAAAAAGGGTAPTCALRGCNKPTFNGRPNEYCSREHRDASKGGGRGYASVEICQRRGCNKPTFDGKPGYCGRGCRG